MQPSADNERLKGGLHYMFYHNEFRVLEKVPNNCLLPYSEIGDLHGYALYFYLRLIIQ